MPDNAPLFVVGCHRSGTTLLRRILNSHPSVWIAKETHFLAYRDMSAEEWRRPLTRPEVESLFAEIRGALTENNWERLPTWETWTSHGEGEPTLVALYRHLCLLEAPRPVTFWGDNTPSYTDRLPMLAQGYPDARFIHIVRDPRDVVRSSLRVWFGGNTALVAAAEWVRLVGAAIVAEQILGDRILRIRFEDLITDPVTTLDAVARFLGVENQFVADDVGEDSSDLAARHRHLRRVGGPLNQAAIGAYRRDLTPGQVRSVEEVTQPWLASLGYELPTWHALRYPTPRFGVLAAHYLANYAINVRNGVRRRVLPRPSDAG